MEMQQTITKNKGGRPKKAIKRNQLMAIKCTAYERKVIEARAKSADLSVSEYLRELGLTGKIDRRNKRLPPEALLLMGEFRHCSANMNQAAKKRNRGDEFSPLERAEVMTGSRKLSTLADQIKSYLL